MLPEFFQIGNFPVRSFGVMMMIAVLVGAYLAMRRAPRYGLDKDAVIELMSWLVLPGILGARLAYIIFNWQTEFAGHPERLWTLRFEGLTSFGALVLGGLGAYLWARRRKIAAAQVLDMMAVPMLVGWAIGRVGCLLNGCCFGRVCHDGFCAHFVDVGYRVPAQWVDIVLLSIAAVLVAWSERIALGKGQVWRVGTSFTLAVIAFAISRFGYEFLRAGTAEEYQLGLASGRVIPGLGVTEAQIASLVLALIGVVWLIVRRGSAPPATPPAAPEA